MKKLLLLIIPLWTFSQNTSMLPNTYSELINTSRIGCMDLDETIIDIASFFTDVSSWGFLGCSDLIPTLESNILSALLPFDIPLDCSTDLTPFGYFDMNVSDICECSCEEYINIEQHSFTNPLLIKKINILGKTTNTKGLHFKIYDNGSIEKIFLIN